MAKQMHVGEQVSELCQEIRSAVESHWVFTAISDYMDKPQNIETRDRFWFVYPVLVNNAFDSMVVSTFNLLDTKDEVLTLNTVASALASAQADPDVVKLLRQVHEHHQALRKAIFRVRNNGVAHLNSKKTSRVHLVEAGLTEPEVRSFMQDLVLVSDAIRSLCAWEVGPPNRRVEAEAAQLFHLAGGMSQHLRSGGTALPLDKLHKRMP